MLSPNIPRTPRFIVKLDGVRMSQDYEVLSVDVYAEANRIPWAEICLLDGDTALRKFRISETSDFDLGKKVQMMMSYVEEPSSEAVVFEGYVTRHAVELDHRGQMLRIECRHAAFFMTQLRRSATFPKQSTDAKAISALFGNYSGKVKGDVGTLTGVTHLELVQYQATDWDFMLSRCQANGWLVMPDGPNLKIVDPSKIAGAVPTGNELDFNVNEIYAIELSLDASEQYESATATAWSFKDQALAKPAKEAGTKLNSGKLDPAAIKMISDGQSQALFSGIAMEAAELKAWSEGAITRSRLAFLRGRFELQGDPKILPGQKCKITGIGTRFDGTGFITGVRQRMNAAGWSTDVQIGLPATPHHQNKDFTDPQAAGLLPGVNGLQIGVVQAFEDDKDGGQSRVRVYVPGMGKTTNLIWARMSTPTAGKGDEKGVSRGMLFWPELGDEVVVGFLNDDPRAAVILGSLYNGTNAPIYPPKADNKIKGLVTNSGSRLEFDDEKQEILLCTKTKLELRIDEKKQIMSVKDRGGTALFTIGKEGIVMQFKDNKLVIDDKGISMEGAGNTVKLDSSGVAVESKAKLAMTAKSGAEMDGGPSVEIKGGTVDLK